MEVCRGRDISIRVRPHSGPVVQSAERHGAVLVTVDPALPNVRAAFHKGVEREEKYGRAAEKEQEQTFHGQPFQVGVWNYVLKRLRNVE